MNLRARLPLIGTAAAVLGVAAAGFWAHRVVYARPRAAIEARRTSLLNEISRMQDSIDKATAARARLNEAAATTLGKSEEGVSAALRSTLNRMIAHAGMHDPAVSTREPQPVLSPARVSTDIPRSVRNVSDFSLIVADLRARGSLSQALTLIGFVQDQPWAHRIESISLIPRGQSREDIELSVSVTTMYFSDLGRELSDDPDWISAISPDQGRWAVVAQRDPFRPPPPPPRAPTPSPPPPAPIPAPPNQSKPATTAVAAREPGPGDWRVVGVVSGKSGDEMWLHNEVSGERRRIHPGETVLDSTFVGKGPRASTARITRSGTPLLVGLNQTLADAQPESQ